MRTRASVMVVCLALVGIGALTLAEGQEQGGRPRGDGQAAPVGTQAPNPPNDLNSLLMESTFLIEGAGIQPLSTCSGTTFILGEQDPKDPNRRRFVLVTAAHVLNDIVADDAILYVRKRAVNGTYAPIPWALPIRRQGKPLWTRHPDPQIDVAVMRVRLPNECYTMQIGVLPIELLADDDCLRRLEIHPGDELLCLGFPRGLSTRPGMFAILRSGKIASYPVIPAAETKVMLYDFNVFPGNSGGPVYMVQSGRVFGGGLNVGIVQFIAGLVTESIYHAKRIEGVNMVMEERERLGLGVVVHARFIRETVDRLPAE